MGVTYNDLGMEMPEAVKVIIKCELPSCPKEIQGYYTTCELHTKVLRMAGLEPKFTTRVKYVYNMTHLPEGDTMFDFRFSASYASRYHHCHGSANLPAALPGFVHPERNDNGMKGEGTRLHKIFQDVLDEGKDLRQAANDLVWLSEVWGPARTQLLQSERDFIIKYFMQFKKAPTIEWHSLHDALLWERPHPKEADKVVVVTVAPLRLVFVAEALRYVADLIDTLDPDSLEIEVEKKRTAEWLTTKPKTTPDIVIRDWEELHMLDLKMGDIEVDVVNNSQLMYGVQTVRRGDEKKIVLHIMQRNHMKTLGVAGASWELPPPVLEEWASAVQESERAILDGDLTLTAGSHCTFCPANPVGRGDKGNVMCPVMLNIAFKSRDEQQADNDVLEDADV